MASEAGIGRRMRDDRLSHEGPKSFLGVLEPQMMSEARQRPLQGTSKEANVSAGISVD